MSEAHSGTMATPRKHDDNTLHTLSVTQKRTKVEKRQDQFQVKSAGGCEGVNTGSDRVM